MVGEVLVAQIEDLVAVASLPLGLVHGHVRVVEQLLGRVLARFGGGDAHAGRDGSADSVGQQERFSQCPWPARRRCLGLGGGPEVFAQDDELVAGQAGQGVAWSEQPGQPLATAISTSSPTLWP